MQVSLVHAVVAVLVAVLAAGLFGYARGAIEARKRVAALGIDQPGRFVVDDVTYWVCADLPEPRLSLLEILERHHEWHETTDAVNRVRRGML